MEENSSGDIMENAPLRNLRQVAWFERTMDASIGALHLTDDRLFAGDWAGTILCWNLEGEELWRVQTNDRVSGFDSGGTNLYAVCGRDIVCIDFDLGEIQWSVELEGSSDLVACTSDGSTVLTTSSVFDIEVNDFMESTCWRFDSTGTLLRRDTLGERPWFIEIRDDGCGHLALGRPRCGMVRVDMEGLHWYPLPSQSPTTCGLTDPDHIVIGHVDGTLTCIDSGFVLEEGQFPKQPGSIRSLDSTPNGLVISVSMDPGNKIESLARAYDWDGHLRWQMETNSGRKFEHVIDGPDLNENPSVWLMSWNGNLSEIAVRAEIDGNPEVRFESNSRVNTCISNAEYIAIGFHDGNLTIIQGELLNRRLSADEDEEKSHRSDLAAKLRALRG